MAVRANALRYERAGVLLVRATTNWTGSPSADVPDLTDPSADGAARAIDWLYRWWQDDTFRAAVQVASPVLSRQITAALDESGRDGEQIRRLVRSAATYLLRWHGRATPFGLFAGVAPARAGARPSVRWGSEHRVRARADSHWLATLILRLEQHPALLTRLPVVANGSVVARGSRLVVPGEPPDGHTDEVAPLEVSLRNTAPIRAAVHGARLPVPLGKLTEQVAGRFPTATPEQITGMLTALVDRRVLLTGLRAPATVSDALAYLLDQLDEVNADEVPGVAALVRELRTIGDGLGEHNRCTSAPAAHTIRTRLEARMGAVADVAPQPLVVDVGLDGEITVPDAVIREAESAAATLLRLTPYPYGYPRWKDFHVRFRRRYGAGAVVPVLDLIADSGLGFPAGYLGSAHGSTARTLTQRDETLLALIQQSVLDGDEEIELTEAEIRTLAVGDLAETLLPPRIEIAVRIHATSPEALDRGAFQLVVVATPRPGSSMAGRFAHLLPDADRAALAESYQSSGNDSTANANEADVITAQLSFAPRRRRSENVTRVPQLLATTIALSEHRGARDGVLEVNDLAVTADARQLYLVHRRTGQRVEPRVVHALEAGVLTPPLARFLAEITTARSAVYKGFDWGAAARLPYLPRLRHGRTILSPARWRLTAQDLDGQDLIAQDRPTSTRDVQAWEVALKDWRHRRHVPATVVLHERDQRLPLDLDQPLHRQLLRASLARHSHVELHEAPALNALGALGRAHELLIPLRGAARSTGAPQPPPLAQAPPIIIRNAGHLPGGASSAWLCAHIGGHPDRHDEILTEHLPRLIQRWDTAREGLGDTAQSGWWFRRHRDTTRPDHDQYLELYLRLPTAAEFGPAAAEVAAWAADLRDHGLVPSLQLATYQPQTGRFGHGTAIAAAEEVFVADSTAALAEITMATSAQLPIEAVVTASLVQLATTYSATPGEGMTWLVEELPRQPGTVSRSLRQQALSLSDPDDAGVVGKALTSHPGGAEVLAAWADRGRALLAYREELHRQRDPQPILRSLLHLHHVRAIGVAPDREQTIDRLARAAALSWTTRIGRAAR